jgi:hypothetical protein
MLIHSDFTAHNLNQNINNKQILTQRVHRISSLLGREGVCSLLAEETHGGVHYIATIEKVILVVEHKRTYTLAGSQEDALRSCLVEFIAVEEE